ncbi:MAG: helix-turn-helix domain-containing protein [Euryarchaeota archaeon]|nr:helix-turn-helix domain-containing protein [Euryarchaeota archaeon]
MGWIRVVGTRELVFAVIVALVGAGLGSGARAIEAEVDARTGVTLPLGRLGDAFRWQGEERVLGQPTPALDVSWAIRLAGVDKSFDRTGAEVATLRVEAQAGDDRNLTGGFQVALDSRAAVRWDHFVEREDAPRRDPMILTEYGPSFKGNWIQRWEKRNPLTPASTPVDLTYLGLQGVELRLNQELPDEAASTFWLGSGLARPGMAVSDFTAEIDGLGRVGNDPALRLTISGAFIWTEPEQDPEDSPTTVFLWWRVPAGVPHEFSRVLWLTSESAYPLVMEDRLKQRGGVEVRRDLALVGLDQGRIAIPWRGDGEALLVPPQPLFEAQPVGTIPRDGGTSICYRMEEALRDQALTGEGTGYAAWSATHPINYPTTAIGNCWAPPGAWLFEYWTGDGHKCRYSVAPPSEKKASYAYVENASAYQRKCAEDADVDARRSFDTSKLPAPRITMAWAEKLWRRTTYTELAEMDVNFIEWGRVVGTYERADPLDATRVLLVGRRHHTVLNATAGAALTKEVQSAYLVVHVETGELLGAQHAFQGIYLHTNLVDQKVVELLNAGIEVNRDPLTKDVGVVSVARTASVPMASITGSLAALAVAALLYFMPLIKFLGTQAWLWTFGYARLGRDDVLENGHRQRILDHVRANPGVKPPELARGLGIAWSTLVYHLSVLEKKRLVSSHVDGRHKYFFPVGEVDHGRRPALAVLRNEKSRAIFELLETEPGLIRDEIAHRMQFTVQAADWHLDRLHRVGLIGADKLGRHLRFYVAARPSAPAETGLEVA